MFMDEAKLSVSLKHPNITKTYEFGRVDGYHFIVMEFVAGQDLRSVLDRLKVHGGVVSQRTAPPSCPMYVRAVLCTHYPRSYGAAHSHRSP